MNRFYSCFRTAFLFAFCLAVSSTLQAANYNYNIGFQTLGITLGTDESLTVTVSGANIVFTLSAGTFSQTGPNGATGGGTGTITVPASNVASSLTVNNTGVLAGTNNVTFDGSSSISTGTLAIDLSGNGVGTVAFIGGFDVSVSTAMNIATNRNISASSGSQLTATGTAPILLEANQQATPTSGSFSGIELDGATVQSTGSGTLTLRGKGGDSGSNQVGVKLSSAAQINGGSGTVTVMGTGGAGTSFGNDGVFVQDAQISSTGGDVFVTGQGGNVSSFFSQGIYLQSGSEITAGGSGTVTVTGTGGAGPNNSYNGVFMIDGRISSSGGDVLVIGQGGDGPAGFNAGVTVRNGSEITAGGSGTVTVTGTGGTGAGPSNYGVFVAFFNSRITSSGGDVLVTGTGGGTGVSADNYGVYLLDEGEITAGGSGTVTVTGTGSASTGSNNYGVFVKDPNTRISSSDGGVLVTGTGSNGAADIIMQEGGAITSTSTSASITLNSTTNGTWPNTNGTDVSTVSPQKTAFSAGSKLNIDIDGTTPQTGYQLLAVDGMIDLTGVELTFNGSTHTPAVGQTFIIVNNDGTDAIIGTFDGLLEGDFISNFLGSGLDALITYVGGDGNDVVLTIIANCNINITNVTTTDEGCPGANDGTLTVTATCASCAGGNADIRYSIDNVDFSNTTGVFTGLADGDYTVYVRDVNDIGCTDSDGPHTIAAGVDNEAPVITCPGNMTVNTDADACEARVCYPSVVATDNCGPATPAGYVYLGNFGNSYYYLNNSLLNYQSASNAARAAGGHLAFITSAAENAALLSWYNGGFAWIGGNDENGVWKWEDCEELVYFNWDTNEPNGVGVENHLEFLVNGNWNDLGSSFLRKSIMEIEGASIVQVSGLEQGSMFPVGTTVNEFVATDASGNMANCSFTITVEDNEDPVISCPSNIEVQEAAPQAGAVVVFADATATDNCSATVLQTAGAASGSTFAVGIHTITFEATDPSLNVVSCSFTIEVTPLYELSGTIRWEHDNAGVEAATVDLTGDASDNTLTNVDGEYDFEVAPGSYTLTPSKTDGLLNGVSVADVMAIQQHVTFINIITDPYKLIAADVNQSSSISTLDALIVAQTILGNPVAEALFLNSWRFVDADYMFPNPASPWSFPATINLTNLDENTPAQDFVGVKMGDVNGSAMPNSNFWDDSWANRNNEVPVLVWQVDDQPLHTMGEELELTFKAGDLNNLVAYQFGLGFSRSHLELLEVIPHEALGLEASHFGTHLADAGELRGLWWEEQEGLSQSLAPGTPVFTLRFRVLRRAEHLKDHLWLDETILKDEAYRADRVRGRVVLEFAEQVVSATDAASSGQIKLYQNVPNPFDEVTRIGFELPAAAEVKLRITDVSGREIQLIEGRFAAGYHEVEVRDLPARGLFFYQLQTEGFTGTLKMVRE